MQELLRVYRRLVEGGLTLETLWERYEGFRQGAIDGGSITWVTGSQVAVTAPSLETSLVLPEQSHWQDRASFLLDSADDQREQSYRREGIQA